MARLVRLTSLFAAAVLFAWVAVEYFRPADGPQFAIEPANYRPDPPLVARTESTIRLRAINQSGRPVRVVGLETC